MIIISIECLRGFNNAYIVKELAIVDVSDYNHQKVQSYLFKPPYAESLLPHHIFSTNSWVTQHLHGIKWNDGYISYSKLHSILSYATFGQDNVLAKGTENCNFLSGMLGREVRNVEDYGCPKAENIKVEIVYCNFKH